MLLMKALLEQTGCKQKDRVKSAVPHNMAGEYCKIANAIAPNNSVALNMLANFTFLSWKTVAFRAGGALLQENNGILTAKEAFAGLQVGDLVHFNGTAREFLITGLAVGGTAAEADVQQVLRATGVSASELVLVRVSCISGQDVFPTLWSEHAGRPLESVQVKELGRAAQLASDALHHTSLPAVRAESHLLLGRVLHTQGDCNEAFEYYRKAFREAPDLTLAVFGAAQILLSRGEFAASLDMFEKVLTRSPEDKDTQAYVMLLKALHQQVLAPLEKLREIAPGFKFEVDLWLLQGQLRQKSPVDHAAALKCFLHAKECIEHLADRPPVPSAVLSNIAVLYHSLGAPEKAIDFCKQALVACARGAAAVTSRSRDSPSTSSCVHTNAEFEHVFYSWLDDPLCFVRPAASSDRFELCAAGVSGGGDAVAALDLREFLSVGEEVVIQGVKHVVREVDAASMVCYSPVKHTGGLAFGDSPDSEAVILPVYVKRSLCNFSDQTITCCYNLARMLEDTGRTKAASELYVELLKTHPSFIECRCAFTQLLAR